MRRDLNTYSSQSAMHHGVPVRVFFRRSSEHHSRNDSSSSTSWSHDSHVFSRSRTLVVPRTFLRVLYNNIHHHVAFARELEEKEKNTEQDQPAVRFKLWNSLFTRKQNAREWKKQTSVYVIKRKMKKKILVYVLDAGLRTLCGRLFKCFFLRFLSHRGAETPTRAETADTVRYSN